MHTGAPFATPIGQYNSETGCDWMLGWGQADRGRKPAEPFGEPCV
jgi:hypothetical protein